MLKNAVSIGCLYCRLDYSSQSVGLFSKSQTAISFLLYENCQNCYKFNVILVAPTFCFLISDPHLNPNRHFCAVSMPEREKQSHKKTSNARVQIQKKNTKLRTPKVTRPGPLAFGLKPSTLSFSVGSDLCT